MQAQSDAQLLREYAKNANEAAFREIVLRHTDLVYTAALRQVDSPDLAGDVAQIVFTDLARKARSVAANLSLNSSLVGWLYRGTRLEALNLLRGEHRRQSRERQAMEQLMPTPETAPDWERLRPVLDEAMTDLSDLERDALLLRFFKNHDLREVGVGLGVSDDAAQKRVSRALEKLRESLSRRGVSTAAGTLAVILSANAVQAAPAGLAVTISSATAVLAGTAVSTSTAIAATRTIAMTTLQKTLITTTIIAAVGTGIYEARQAATLRTQVRTFQRQQAPFAEQIQQLQRERDAATNQLAAANETIAQLKSEQKQAELLRLRGQVGTLRQQLASTEAKANAPSSGFAKMMSDPAMREYMHQALVDLIKRRYGPLFQELKLTPEQIDKFVQLMGDTFQKGVQRLAASPPGTVNPAEQSQPGAEERAGLEEQLKSVLDESGVARFKEYSQEIPARTTVDLLNTQLGANQLSDEQRSRLFQVVKAEPFELTHGISGDLDKVFFGSPEDVENHLSKVAESNQRVIQQASSFLSPEQVAALNTVLSNGITARITQGAALTQKN